MLFSRKNSECSVRDILLVPSKTLGKFTYKIISNCKKKYNTHYKNQTRIQTQNLNINLNFNKRKNLKKCQWKIKRWKFEKVQKGVFTGTFYFSLFMKTKTMEKNRPKIWPKTFAYFLHNWDRGGGGVRLFQSCPTETIYEQTLLCTPP